MSRPADAALFRGEPAAELLPLALIETWPGNPRRTIDPVRLQELADSMATAGVLQPILVRPNGAMFSIVLGERRYRAAKMAGLTHIPATVRELDDGQALRMAVTENLQREDVPPLEEAEGYERLHREFGYSVEDIAHRVGKSRTYVYSRLKLTDLCEEARGYVRDGHISPTVALLIARIPTPSQQAHAAKMCAADHRGQPLSVTDARRYILGHYMTMLSEAVFDPGDASLIPAAGACGDCPKRTGSQPELFGDIQSDDTCTDLKCYDAKTARHWARLAEQHEAAGGKVLRGEEAAKIMIFGENPAAGWVAGTSRCRIDNAKRTWAEVIALAKRPPKPVLAETSGGRFVELWPEDQAMKIAAKLGMKTAPEAEQEDAPKHRPQTKPAKAPTPAETERTALLGDILRGWPRALTQGEARLWLRDRGYDLDNVTPILQAAGMAFGDIADETDEIRTANLIGGGPALLAGLELAVWLSMLEDEEIAYIAAELAQRTADELAE